MFLLGLLEAVPIEFEAAFHGQRFGQFRREAVGLQEVERLAAGDGLGLSIRRLIEEPLHPRHAGVDHLEELAFLVPQPLSHALDRLLQFGVGAFHQVGHDLGQVMQERFVDAHLIAVQHGPADQLADHVALFLVVGIDVFMDGERAGPHVVGDAPQPATVVSCNVAIAIRFVLHVADLAGRLDQRAEDVDMIVGFHALQHGGHAFKTHARIDVLAGQRTEVVGRGADAVELREDQVPDLDRSAGRGDVDFAARPANAVRPLAGGAGGPEVLVLVQPLEAIGRELDLVEPDVGRFFVVQVDRGRKPLGIDAQPLFAGQKLPGPEDGVALEVVAEAEVAQHFEKRMVIGRAADVIDVARAEAFLTGRRPGELQFAAAEEVVLELVHAGRREQDRRVPAGHQHVAGPANTTFGLEERQVFFPQFVAFHANHHLARRKEDG